MRLKIPMDKDSFYLLLTFLYLGYWVIRSLKKSKESQEEAKIPIAPPPLQMRPVQPRHKAVQPSPSRPVFKEIKNEEPLYPKNSRARELRLLAKRGKDWVVLSEILKKKFDF